jgi:hypothetical protein
VIAANMPVGSKIYPRFYNTLQSGARLEQRKVRKTHMNRLNDERMGSPILHPVKVEIDVKRKADS